ncbi:MAG: glycosyltransferase [Saprospiraceae bacterium]
MERVPRAGYAIEGLNIDGFQRKLSMKNLAFPFKLLCSSLRKAKRIVRDFAPNVVVGTGGYASGPVMRAAQGLEFRPHLQRLKNLLKASESGC